MRVPREVAVAVIALAMVGCGSDDAESAKKPPRANTGAHGSACKPVQYNGPAPAPDPTLDTMALGPSAPAAYEIGRPTGATGGKRRVMMLVHGGGWYLVGRRAVEGQRSLAAKWRAAGWETVSVTYRGCRRSVKDVLTFYDLVRRRVGDGVPICLLGQSAGGHLAQMVAARRSSVACVFSMAGPSDLRRIARHGRALAARANLPKLVRGSRWGAGLARATFGRSGLARNSPVTYARRVRARLLLATSADDPIVPATQDARMARAVRRRAGAEAYADAYALAPGSGGFIHGSASPAALAELDARVARLVAPFGPAPAGAAIP